MNDKQRIVFCQFVIGEITPGPTEADLVRPYIHARREGNTIIATVPTPRGGRYKVYKTCARTRGRVSVDFSKTDNETFEYAYVISNEPSAVGNVIWLRFNNLNFDEDTTAGALPKGWISLGSMAGWIVEFKNDMMGNGIAPSETAGPFTLHSRLGPGLRRLVIAGPTSETQFISEGVHDALYGDGGPFSEDNLYSIALTIAPKLDRGLEAVRHELSYAASLPECAAIHQELKEIGERCDANDLKADLMNVHAKTPLQKDFIRAMLTNCERG